MKFWNGEEEGVLSEDARDVPSRLTNLRHFKGPNFVRFWAAQGAALGMSLNKKSHKSVGAQVKESLERILQGCSSEWLHQRELVDVKSTCHAALTALQSDTEANKQRSNSGDRVHADSGALYGEDADRIVCSYFTPYKTALECNVASVAAIALEALHYFLVHGMLRGRYECPLQTKGLRVVDILIQSVATCANIQDPKVFSLPRPILFDDATRRIGHLLFFFPKCTLLFSF